jgi:GT2 family glycosyltransferase
LFRSTTLTAPSVSIIIPTYNRGSITCETLGHLLRQDYPNFEIIVIDQSSVVEPAVDQFYRDNREKIRYYRLDRPALPYARNSGIKLSKGDILLFLDNDIIPFTDQLVSYHVRHFSDPKIGGVAGSVLLKGHALRENVKRVGTLRRIDFKYEHNFDSDTPVDVDLATGCNMSFRKEVLFTVNGFSDLFTQFIYLDDSDISLRVRKLGYRIVFDPEACVIHLEADGGNREETENPYNKSYRMFHNEAVFYFKNLNPLFFPVFFIQEIRRTILRSVKTKVYRFVPGIKGLVNGTLKGSRLLFDKGRKRGNLDSVENLSGRS